MQFCKKANFILKATGMSIQFIVPPYHALSQNLQAPTTKVVDTASAAVNMSDEKSQSDVHRQLQVLLVLPVSTGETEGRFSKVERTLVYLRSTMSEGSLEALFFCRNTGRACHLLVQLLNISTFPKAQVIIKN